MAAEFLRQALALAKVRRGFCAPNPAVGAVIVKNNQVIATGHHWAAGLLHAEQSALLNLGEQTQDASLYVTLEPCCHWGKTPPCTQSIIDSGIKQVYFGMIDPNPKVSGQSIYQLEQAGIRCQPIEIPEIKKFYRSYLRWTQQKRPWITAKLAMSLDGKIAGESSHPIKITGSSLQAYTHLQRKYTDAILTTARTINQDNSQLNVRFADSAISKPVYVLSSQLNLADNLNIYKTAARLTFFHSNQVISDKIEQLVNQGFQCIAVDHSAHGLDLEQVMQHIGRDGVHDLWVEAGGKCVTSLIKQQLVDTLLFYVAPTILGESCYPAFKEPQLLLAAATSYQWNQYGKDAVCEMDFAPAE